MEKFGGAPKIRWEGKADIAAEALGHETLQKADEILAGSDLKLEEANFKVREVIHEADPFAPLPQAAEKAAKILSQNEVLAQADLEQAEKADASNDRRFDHFGSQATTTNIRPVVVPPRKAYVPPPAPKSFLKRLFGG